MSRASERVDMHAVERLGELNEIVSRPVEHSASSPGSQHAVVPMCADRYLTPRSTSKRRCTGHAPHRIDRQGEYPLCGDWKQLTSRMALCLGKSCIGQKI